MITVDNIKSFQISGICLRHYPCKHICTIKLLDGREKRITLAMNHISILVNSIAKRKSSALITVMESPQVSPLISF